MLVGCGALGGTCADLLVRAGVGSMRILDRDVVELDNLQRQQLFWESDVKDRLPKAVAAERRLRGVNSGVRVEGIVTDLNGSNAEALLDGADLVVDGTDNFETRFVVNDACFKAGRPWVYGGCVGGYGMTMLFVPGRTACFRCLVGEAPDPEHIETCDTAGIVNAASAVTASLETAAALRYLAVGEVEERLVTVDVWRMRVSSLRVPKAEGCPTCRGEYEYLGTERSSLTAVLCGRNAVQVSAPPGRRVNLREFARKAPGAEYNGFLLRFEAEGHGVTLFDDGRAIFHGLRDPARARTLYARYVGS